jgi:hypothetical protein
MTGSVSVAVDGRVALRLPKPRFQDPWREARVAIGSHTVVVALIHAFVLQTDVFVDGQSLIDGRSIDEARAAAPASLRGYNLWFRDHLFVGWPSWEELGWQIAFGLVGTVVLALVFVVEGGPPDRALAVALVVVSLMSLLVMSLVFWDRAVRWINTRLLAHTNWGDARRTLALMAAFLGLPVVAFMLLIALIVALR